MSEKGGSVVWVVDVLVIIFGLISGSFYNVVAIRLPLGQSVAYPSSHCPSCQHRLGVLNLIPVLSYVFNLGRCRYCHHPISVLYPFSELATACSFYAVYKMFGLDVEMWVGWLLASLLIIAMLTDMRYKLILDVFTLPAIIIFLVLRLLTREEAWSFYVLGGVMGFVVLLLISWVSRGGMGGGDIKLYAAIGVAVGPWLMLLSLGLASLFGALVGGLLMAVGRVQRKQPVPFAPFIWLGTMVSYLVGTSLWQSYIGIILGT